MRQEREAAVSFVLPNATPAAYNAAQARVGLGRTQLGKLKQIYALGGRPMPANTARYPDGTIIKVISIPTATGIVQDYIKIDVSSVRGLDEPGGPQCIGILSGLADITSPVIPIQVVIIDGEEVDSVNRFYIKRIDQDDGSESKGPWENYLETSEDESVDNIGFLDPFRSGILSEVKPGRYSGRMRKLVQTMYGMGLARDFQYSFSATDGIWRGSDGTEWLISIRPGSWGVIATLFDQCQHAVSGIANEEDIGNQQQEIWDNLGFVPTESAYPFPDSTTIAAGIADGTILHIMDKDEMLTFIPGSMNSFFDECGWAWTNDCRECQNVVWNRPGDKKFSYRYKIIIGGGTQPTSATISQEESGQIWMETNNSQIKYPNYFFSSIESEDLQYGEVTGDETLSDGPLYVFYNQTNNTEIVSRMTAGTTAVDTPLTGQIPWFSGPHGLPGFVSAYGPLLKDGTERVVKLAAIAVDPDGTDVGTDEFSVGTATWASFNDSDIGGMLIDPIGQSFQLVASLTGSLGTGGSWETRYFYTCIVPLEDREAIYRYSAMNEFATGTAGFNYAAKGGRSGGIGRRSSSPGATDSCGPGLDGRWISGGTVIISPDQYTTISNASSVPAGGSNTLYSSISFDFNNPACTTIIPGLATITSSGAQDITFDSGSTLTFFDGNGASEIIRTKPDLNDDTQFTLFVTPPAQTQVFQIVPEAWSGHRLGSLEADGLDASDPLSVFTQSGTPTGFPVDEVTNILNCYWFGIPT